MHVTVQEVGVTEYTGLQEEWASSSKVFLFRKKEVNLGLNEPITRFSFFRLTSKFLSFSFYKNTVKTLIAQYVERYNYINTSHIWKS